MAPTLKELEQALIDGTCHVFQAESDATTVNKIRRHVEERFDLEDGFFAGDDWRQKSKTIIKEYVDKLMNGWQPDSPEVNAEVGSDAKNSKKRRSTDPTSPEPKRPKRAAQPTKSSQRQKSEKSQKQKATKTKPRRKSPSPELDAQGATSSSLSSLGDEDEAKDEPEDERSAAHQEPAEDQPQSKNKLKASTNQEQDAKSSVAGPAINDEEEYSDVLDEAPTPKRKKKAKGEPRAKKSKSGPKPESAAAPKADDTGDGEVKKLQSQLVKCGVRKLWHNELKKYGDDTRAKIRHLKKMLSDIGMEGRFSATRAKEIKEMRELMAEAEAAQEMNRLWGMGGRSRSNRSKSKSAKPDDESEAEAGGTVSNGQAHNKANDDDSDQSQDNSFAARSRRARADLDFLGDDSDSD